MLNDQRASTSHGQDNQDEDEQIRDIHALTPPQPPPVNRGRRREAWETSSHRSSLSVASDGALSENFTSMSREFSALVVAGSTFDHTSNNETEGTINGNNLRRIGEEEMLEEENNPLAIVPDNNPLDPPVASPRRDATAIGGGSSTTSNQTEISVQRVKKEEVDSKISAWQNAKVAKINNRFKREDAVINGWESEQVQKATSWMKKVECSVVIEHTGLRIDTCSHCNVSNGQCHWTQAPPFWIYLDRQRKLEEKRARALEKMQNDVAKARRKAEEKRASAEAKRGTKAARVLEVANLMRAVGRAPVKRSFF